MFVFGPRLNGSLSKYRCNMCTYTSKHSIITLKMIHLLLTLYILVIIIHIYQNVMNILVICVLHSDINKHTYRHFKSHSLELP